MLCIQAALCESTGSSETLVFHTLSAGNIGQLGAPSTVVPVTALTAGGADPDGTADEGWADGDGLGCGACHNPLQRWLRRPSAAALRTFHEYAPGRA